MSRKPHKEESFPFFLKVREYPVRAKGFILHRRCLLLLLLLLFYLLFPLKFLKVPQNDSAVLFRFPVQLVQCFAEALCLFFRKLCKQPFVKECFNFRFGIFSRITAFSVAYRSWLLPSHGFGFTDQISLCLKACSAPCSGPFINL